MRHLRCSRPPRRRRRSNSPPAASLRRELEERFDRRLGRLVGVVGARPRAGVDSDSNWTDRRSRRRPARRRWSSGACSRAPRWSEPLPWSAGASVLGAAERGGRRRVLGRRRFGRRRFVVVVLQAATRSAAAAAVATSLRHMVITPSCSMFSVRCTWSASAAGGRAARGQRPRCDRIPGSLCGVTTPISALSPR